MRAIAAVLMAGMMLGQTPRSCVDTGECVQPMPTMSECNIAGGSPVMRGDWYIRCELPPKPKVTHKDIDWGKVDKATPQPDTSGGYFTIVHPNEVLGSFFPAPPDESRVDKLTYAEYAKLQSLRQAVRDEETAIAKAHGVRFGEISTTDSVRPISLDSYEFHGQYLLINVPKE